jgi:hypothetical protein
MFLRFDFDNRHYFCCGNLSITAAWNAWGGLSLGVCDMKYRKEAMRMMVRSGSALMRGSARNDGGHSGREDEMVRRELWRRSLAEEWSWRKKKVLVLLGV